MSTDDDAIEIRTGGRWDATLAAILDAEIELEAPLSDDELEEGWSEELRTAILSDVRRVRDELEAGGGAPVALQDWTGVDVVDPQGEAARAVAIFDVDLALGDLERAELLLGRTTRFLSTLAVSSSGADVESGFDERVRAQLHAMLDDVRRVLAAGEYLSRSEMDPWADALRSYGFLRAASPLGGEGNATSGETGFSLQRIEQFPPGRRFEELAIYDGWLCNVAMTDVFEEDGQLDGSEDDDVDEPVDLME